MRKHNIQSGEIYSRLTVRSFFGYDKSGKNRLYSCVCECGNLVTVQPSHLKRGSVKSCGCLSREKASLRQIKQKGIARVKDSAARALFSRYRGMAKFRQISFDLTQEQFRSLIKNDCFYCGAPPSQVYKNRTVDFCIYNGIDRKNNDLGYFINNVVTCCGQCNGMKSDYSLNEFLEKIKKIATRFSL